MRKMIMIAVLAGCGGRSIEGGIEELESYSEQQAQIICGCYQDLGAESAAECMAEFYMPMAAGERACLVEALEQDEEASQEFLDCLLPLWSEVIDCLEESVVCSGDVYDQMFACYETVDARAEVCQNILPASVDAAADACFGG